MHEMETKVLVSCMVMAELICTYVLAYTESRFSHDTINIFCVYRESTSDCKDVSGPEWGGDQCGQCHLRTGRHLC